MQKLGRAGPALAVSVPGTFGALRERVRLALTLLPSASAASTDDVATTPDVLSADAEVEFGPTSTQTLISGFIQVLQQLGTGSALWHNLDELSARILKMLQTREEVDVPIFPLLRAFDEAITALRGARPPASAMKCRGALLGIWIQEHFRSD